MAQNWFTAIANFFASAPQQHEEEEDLFAALNVQDYENKQPTYIASKAYTPGSVPSVAAPRQPGYHVPNDAKPVYVSKPQSDEHANRIDAILRSTRSMQNYVTVPHMAMPVPNGQKETASVAPQAQAQAAVQPQSVPASEF